MGEHGAGETDRDAMTAHCLRCGSDETTCDVDHYRELAARWEANAMRQAEAARDARAVAVLAVSIVERGKGSARG